MQRKYLWQPDPASPKDWSASAVLKVATPQALPESFSLANLIVSILDQGGLGACAANAVAQALRAVLVKASQLDPLLASRLWLYYFARAMMGSTQVDSGTYLRNVLDVTRKLGMPPEAAWPYADDPVTFMILPSGEARRLAFDQVGRVGYYKIDATGADRVLAVKTAIASGYVVVFGTQVAQAFEDYKADSPPLKPPADGDKILGGHALCLAEYGAQDGVPYIGGPNSWGLGWGRGGWFRMTEDYVADSRSSDFWFVQAAPQFTEQP
jgi:Papain family cysteine protease